MPVGLRGSASRCRAGSEQPSNETGCVAACQGGPIVAVQPDGVWYYNVTDENMDRIVEEHLKNGRVVEDLVFHRNGSGE